MTGALTVSQDTVSDEIAPEGLPSVDGEVIGAMQMLWPFVGQDQTKQLVPRMVVATVPSISH